MNYRLVVIKSKREEWHDAVVSLYQKKIQAFCSFEVIELKSSKQAREDAQSKTQEEGKTILASIKDNEWVVVLDERGKAFTSVDFAHQMQRWQDTGRSRICFVIGGAFGLSDEVKKRANATLSLSAMVMNHMVAQVVLLEQIYRSFCIQKNIPYHNS
ncbi:MAG TPA: 23S rRNA (pseudouridine(1915)-N(3))-methyltransferase RlmH [Pseudobdellovibrionaceae bacterium]|nr:23S rRNA (pseudouridine(1915)-N(3))-methyltransferase RlmH [Pseudobdellovibrionaceae bacterium]